MRAILTLLMLVGCGAGEWTAVSEEDAPEMRSGAATTWTGSEVFLWGGNINQEQFGCLMGANDLRTGALYDPSTDTWTPTSLEGAPETSGGLEIWWTGARALVWTQLGGAERPYLHLYDPGDDSWTAAADPEEMLEHDPTYHPVWTGEELIAWAPGYDSAAYDPSTDSWRAIRSFGDPGVDRFSRRAWTGTDMLIWSYRPYGTLESTLFYRYTPATDTWTDLGTEGGPVESLDWDSPAVWSGEEFILLDDAGKTRPWHYDPAADSWRIGPLGPNGGTKMAWTEERIVSWAGDTRGVFYEPASGDWFKATPKARPRALNLPAMQWTDDALFVWGGGATSPCDEERGEGGGIWRP
ncbi:MAG: hypothetical protein KC912_23510 [Proteobacteria bacterium]|nr:hypothetical protein [Pseudomonadota bacterium]